MKDTRIIRVDDEVYDLVVKRRDEMLAAGDREASLTTAMTALVAEGLAREGA